MASELCTDWWARSYLGAWNGWTNNFNLGISDGYCYASGSSTTYAYCFYFKTPNVSSFHKSTRIDFMIPVVRTSGNFATSGTLYFKLLASDPTGGSITSDLKPTISNCDASYDWKITDEAVHRIYFSISTSSLKSNTGYYMTVSGNKLLGIGYLEYLPGGWWSATLNYETHGYVTANKPSITDNGNNTFTIVGSAGNSATNNAVKSTTLHYKRGNEAFTQASSLTYSGRINCEAAEASQKITAYTAVDGVYNDTTSESREATVLNYVKPGDPGNPYLNDSSFKNGRLTVKQDWVWQWTPATATNKSSPVTGYRIRLYKNGWSIPIKNASGNTLSVDGGEGQAWSVYYDTESTYTSITIDPIKHGIVPGDQVYLGIYAYSKNGNNNQLFSEYITSDTNTVQNAGVVNIKVAGEWVEGQVWVKANGKWHEAETVSTKVNGKWEESQ